MDVIFTSNEFMSLGIDIRVMFPQPHHFEYRIRFRWVAIPGCTIPLLVINFFKKMMRFLAGTPVSTRSEPGQAANYHQHPAEWPPDYDHWMKQL